MRSIHAVSHNGCTNLHSYQQCRSVPFSPHTHQHLSSLIFLMIAILTGVRSYLCVVVICILLMIKNISFHISVAICMSSLNNYLFRSSAHFNRIVWVFAIHLYDTNPLLDIWFANIFSHSIGCFFILFIVSFTVKCFNLMWSDINFCFCCSWFCRHIQKIVVKTNFKEFLLVFF